MDNTHFHDVDGIKYVINYDYPNSSEDYIHRIGRTGRSECTGTSYAFFTPSNSRQARDLLGVLKEANQVINPKLAEIANRSSSFGKGGFSRYSDGSGRGNRGGSRGGGGRGGGRGGSSYGRGGGDFRSRESSGRPSRFSGGPTSGNSAGNRPSNGYGNRGGY